MIPNPGRVRPAYLITLFLFIFNGFGNWAQASCANLVEADFIKTMRATIFAEEQVRALRQGRLWAAPDNPLSLTREEAKGACSFAMQNVTISLLAQGVSWEDIAITGFGWENSTHFAHDIFWGLRAPGHRFTLYRAGTGYIAIDPTLVQFENYAFYRALKSNPTGVEIIQELRHFGFWRVTQERWTVFLNALSQNHAPLRRVEFEDIETIFNKNRTGPKSREDIPELNSIDRETIEKRSGSKQPS